MGKIVAFVSIALVAMTLSCFNNDPTSPDHATFQFDLSYYLGEEEIPENSIAVDSIRFAFLGEDSLEKYDTFEYAKGGGDVGDIPKGITIVVSVTLFNRNGEILFMGQSDTLLTGNGTNVPVDLYARQPAAPRQVSVGEPTGHSARITWTDMSTREDGYLIERGTTAERRCHRVHP
ncbi:MAG: hypothetical protein GF344_09505 [Chitinivibrionales bacterium]|nr:hypothetical protein [Chitinivibrionales bacterium]MBD3357079.1 hypothetical protein [Chitinivibrionales bacterium]